MPTFRIVLARTRTEYQSVTVEAETSDSAEVQALALADSKQANSWEPLPLIEAPARVLDVDPL